MLKVPWVDEILTATLGLSTLLNKSNLHPSQTHFSLLNPFKNQANKFDHEKIFEQTTWCVSLNKHYMTRTVWIIPRFKKI